MRRLVPSRGDASLLMVICSASCRFQERAAADGASGLLLFVWSLPFPPWYFDITRKEARPCPQRLPPAEAEKSLPTLAARIARPPFALSMPPCFRASPSGRTRRLHAS